MIKFHLTLSSRQNERSDFFLQNSFHPFSSDMTFSSKNSSSSMKLEWLIRPISIQFYLSILVEFNSQLKMKMLQSRRQTVRRWIQMVNPATHSDLKGWQAPEDHLQRWTILWMIQWFEHNNVCWDPSQSSPGP